MQKIVEAGGAVMGGRYDYPHYYFLNVADLGGGLEHKNSFLGMAGRFTTRSRRAYLGWLGLIAHEDFHNWNIKRLRPSSSVRSTTSGKSTPRRSGSRRGLPTTTRAAGQRAGLSTRDEYFDELTAQIEAVQRRRAVS